MSSDSAGITIPGLTELPSSGYIKGPRYPITFDRIQIPKFGPAKPDWGGDPLDKPSELEEALIGPEEEDWREPEFFDIRQVLLGNAIKDMIEEEDRKFFAAVNSAVN